MSLEIKDLPPATPATGPVFIQELNLWNMKEALDLITEMKRFATEHDIELSALRCAEYHGQHGVNIRDTYSPLWFFMHTVFDEMGTLEEKDRALLVRELIAQGMSVQGVEENGVQAVHDAALMREWDVLWELVAAGADLNAQMRSGETALHFWIKQVMDEKSSEGLELAKKLIHHGADPRIEDRHGQSATSIAKNMRFWRILPAYLEEVSLALNEKDALEALVASSPAASASLASEQDVSSALRL